MSNDLYVSAYNPDVLSCIANLSNDEVFTPPNIANAMLDMLPQELFRDPNTTFLDPAAKSGVFLREIAKRLLVGLEDVFPDLQERVDHIFQKQLFGIAITEITSLLARRSVYCSKTANGNYSVCRFGDVQGNIRYKRIQHKWNDGRCLFCGASQSQYDRDESLETHAYEFIHTTKPEDIFHMKFDVIICNPTYQLNDGGGNGASARPIYQLFVMSAKKLNPRYISMITPSRWFTGGKGLDEYRDEMLHDNRLRIIHDFPEASDCFSGVQIKGGVSYFLWDRDNAGDCAVYSHRGEHVFGPVNRPLLEKGCDTFIRYNEAVAVLHKVRAFTESSMENLVSTRMPFGLPNTYKGTRTKQASTDLKIYISGNDREIRGTTAYVSLRDISKGREMIPWHKVFIAKAGSGSDTFPHPILPKPFYGEPYSICNESYLVIGPFKDKTECENVILYRNKVFSVFGLIKEKLPKCSKRCIPICPHAGLLPPLDR